MKSFILLFVLVLTTVTSEVAFAKKWGSTVTPELQKFCKKAGGTTKIFPDSCVSTCKLVKYKRAEEAAGRSIRCLAMQTANCDCGPDKCLENDKCIPIPK